MSDPLISVIVPIYNVEKYVRKCLDSLKDQMMKQIEVICIDDGSTDSSGAIADEYASDEWPVFHIIHTENRGLSAARNRGIDEARSDWIMFVDSDDWVDPRYCKIPHDAAIENRADMVIFARYLTNESGKIKRNGYKKKTYGLIDHETAIDIGDKAVWNKLYKRALFTRIKYPEGHVHEDSAITHRLVYKAERIIYIGDRLYFYRYRKGSICHSLSGENDRLISNKHRYEELIKLGYPENKARGQLLGAALRCCGRANKGSFAYCEASRLIDSTKEEPFDFSQKEKLMLTAWRINRSLYRFVYKGYIRTHEV